MIKLLGVIFVVIGCGSVGFQIAASYRREEKSLQQLLQILEYMECELAFRLTPLPDLCKQVSKLYNHTTSRLFAEFAKEMESQICPDASCCIAAVLHKRRDIPPITRQILTKLGASIGRFDLSGQMKGLNSSAMECKRNLDCLSNNREHRLRSYQTLSLCAGAALAILLI